MPRRQSATPGLCQEPSVAESLGTVYKSPSVRCLSGCACVFEGETKTTRLPPPSIPPPPEVNLTFRPISTLDGKEKKSEYQTRSLPRSPPGPEVYPLLPPLQTPSHLFTRHSADWLSASPPFSPPPQICPSCLDRINNSNRIRLRLQLQRMPKLSGQLHLPLLPSLRMMVWSASGLAAVKDVPLQMSSL
jgi:hypothetical protein